MPIHEATLRRLFEDLTRGGGLDVLTTLLDDGAVVVEQELLARLEAKPLESATQQAEFSYRQGWLHALRQTRRFYLAMGAEVRARTGD